MIAATPKVLCPQCGAEAVWGPANPWRPFCSERCKMIDFGCWASESYRVPVSDEAEIPEAEPPGAG